MSKGYVAWWQTLELGFSDNIPAHIRYDILCRLWTRTLNDRGVKKLKTLLDPAYLRVLEETLIRGTWTPHFHVAWIFPAASDETQIGRFLDEVSSRWRILQARDPDLIDTKRVLYTSPLDKSVVPKMQYLFKSFFLRVGEAGIVIPSPPKRPIDFLMSALAFGDWDHMSIWKQYEFATHKKRRIKFSSNWIFSPQ